MKREGECKVALLLYGYIVGESIQKDSTAITKVLLYSNKIDFVVCQIKKENQCTHSDNSDNKNKMFGLIEKEWIMEHMIMVASLTVVLQ